MIMKVIDVWDETPDTRTIRFALDREFNFKPGQFVMVNADIVIDGVKKFVKRAYSISSSPLTKDYLDLTVKIYPEKGLVSKRLFNMKLGEEMDIAGPYGHFVFDENAQKNIVLLAGGVGITPLACMLRYIKDKNLKDNKATLIYSSKTIEDITFKKELMSNNYPKNINIHLTITRPNGEKWSGLTGRIDEKMIRNIVNNIQEPYYFICGPTTMVEDTNKLLKSINVKEEKIKLERFG